MVQLHLNIRPRLQSPNLNGVAGLLAIRSLARSTVIALFLVGSGAIFPATSATSGASTSDLQFNRDIRPILSDNCFACHGPDKKARKAKLRLDTKEGLFAADDDYAIVAPGRSKESELFGRVSTSDPDDLMPPPDSEKQLTPAQIELLRRWIDLGAPYEGHWAFQSPRRPEVPAMSPKRWRSGNPIDAFVLAKLRTEGLKPAREAPRRTLLRRLSFDLTGLPPTADEVETFVKDRAPRAYLNQIDRLLASKHFGERMAQMWLDLARYADSDGYHDDTTRSMWQYRDYVIQSFNKNRPFDQFTIEQLAGDLIPNATLEQKIASAFHRNGPTSSEGGADAKEYAARYAVDRVNTTATTWLGITMQCAECHDHKYDPFTTREFYRLFAFFNQVPEQPLQRALHVAPVIPTPTPEQRTKLDELTSQVQDREQALKSALEEPDSELDEAQIQWEPSLQVAEERFEFGPWLVLGPFSTTNQLQAYQSAFGPETNLDLTANYDGGKLVWSPRKEWDAGLLSGGPKGLGALYLHRTIRVHQPVDGMLFFGSDDQMKVWINGVLLHDSNAKRNAKPNQAKVPLKLLPGEHHLLCKLANRNDGSQFYFSTNEKEGDPAYVEARRIAALPPGDRAADERLTLQKYYRQNEVPRIPDLKKELDAAKKARTDFDKTIPRLRVMADVPERRPTHILVRGDYRRPGEEVTPGVPEALGGPPDEMSPDRLALAKWITSPDHPLTARVMVNRLWQMLFGMGLVKTVEEFGSQGEPPSHPQLLDWLAVEFVESGWDVKHILKRITSSSTYRQSSHISSELYQRDPENRLLARGPRFRLPAEMIRDNALAVAGLLDLDRPVGGPSVKPYQPGDLWREFSYGDSAGKGYVRSTGKDLYRRGIYTFWKRSILHPAYASFDAPNREVCTARRPVTNTPLQAYVLLNDETFIEAARVFAGRVMTHATRSRDRFDHAFLLALARPPTSKEKRIMSKLLRDTLEVYEADRAAAEDLLNIGDWPRARQFDVVEHAAWTCVANAILNLDETVTKE